jgi:hypothetical protein
MFGSHLLILLVLAPVIAYWLARRHFPKRVFTIAGAVFGAVVSPLALGLYSLYHLSAWGVVPGFVGLALTLFHGVPGFTLAVHADLIPSGVVVDDLRSTLIIESINGMVWALVYGLIGTAIDRARTRRQRAT